MSKFIGMLGKLCKRTRLIPLMIYPYVYLACIAFAFFCFFISSSFLDKEGVNMVTGVTLTVLVIFALIYHFVLICVCLYHSYTVAKGSYPLKDYAKLNIIIRCIHIPGYIFHFIMGFLGMCMSIWGIGFVLLAVCVNIGTVFFSALSSLGYVIRMKRLRLLSTSCSIVFGIALLFFGADFVIAVASYIIINNYEKRRKPLPV